MICRNPEYMRPSKRGAGKETKETAKAELTMPDGGVISGISAVNEKMTRTARYPAKSSYADCDDSTGGFFKAVIVGNEGARCDFP